MPDDYGFKVLLENIKEGLKAFVIDFLGMDKHRDTVEDAGFINVEQKIWRIPIGPWAKDPKMKTVGLYNRSIATDALQGAGMGPFTRGLKWT